MEGLTFADIMDLSYPPFMSDVTEGRSASSSFSDSNSVSSEDCGYTLLERHHFDRALNQGVFNEFAAKEKKSRKRNYEKGMRRSNEDLQRPKGNTERIHRDRVRGKSTSFDLRECPRRGDCVAKQGDKFRTAFSNNDMGLLKIDDEIDLDKIHGLRQQYFEHLPPLERHSSYVSLHTNKDIDGNYPLPFQQKSVLRMRSSTVM